VTTPTGVPRSNAASRRLTAFAITPMLAGCRSSTAFRACSSASSIPEQTRSRYPVSTRRRARASSTSATRHTPPFMVMASGWAPPMPPSPAVSTRRPARLPPKWRPAHSAKVSNVPWTMPCDPM